MDDASAGYVVKEIDGLDPVNATLTSSTMAQLDGAQFQNAVLTTRNITIKLGLEPDYVNNTVDSLRSALYDYLLPMANIQLGFYKDGTLFAVTSGQVESFENSMFSNDPEIDISIICYDPAFYAPEPVTVSGTTTTGTDTTTITYDGTTPTGIIFDLTVNQDCLGFTVYNTDPLFNSQVYSLNQNELMESPDIITINSIPGQKSIIDTTSGTPRSILYYVDPAATWPLLSKGDNQFRVYFNDAVDGEDLGPMNWTLSYTPKYAGL